MSRFQLASLDAMHDRAAFSSDSEPLNHYLREQVTQDVRRRVAACFVALADGKQMAGYYNQVRELTLGGEKSPRSAICLIAVVSPEAPKRSATVAFRTLTKST